MTFVQGKFYTLFSMLFGMGFAIQAERLGDQVEIVSGVKAGEPVVVQPGNLTGGQAVTLEK
jgi:hypothetical protein